MGKRNDMVPDRGKWDGIVNVLGILAAFGIAFGGLFLVRRLLWEEETALLQGSGVVSFASRETDVTDWAETVKPADTSLTLEELELIVEKLEEDAQAYPHEPLQGQLSMAEAIDCGRSWLEEFLMPRLGAEEYLTPEYRASCYLMALQGEGGEEEAEVLSYWMVSLVGRNVEAGLLLNAVTGQVLDASIGCYFPVDGLEKEGFMDLLDDYADSFGTEGEYAVVSTGKLTEAGDVVMFQDIGDSKVFAAVKTGMFSVSPSASWAGEHQDVFRLRLYLCRSIY